VIHLDVTSTARRRLQTGVPRMVRGIYEGLAARRAVTPLAWGATLPAYTRLRREQAANLADPFRAAPAAPPVAGPLAHAARWLHERFHRIDLPARMAENDLLFVTEIFQDGRIDFFQSLLPLPRGKAWVLFYDALVWSLPEYAPADRNPRFEDYLAVLARFDGVVCISRESEADLHRFWSERGIAAAPTRVLLLPMPLAAARPAPAAPRPGRKRLLVVATLEPRKNHLRLLAACASLWARGVDFEVELIGRAVGAGSDPVRREIERLQRGGAPLAWLAHVDDAKLEAAYRDCAFTVYPSIREGFGLPILESLWHHRPCICGGTGALGEAAEGGGCLFIYPTDTASLAAGIERLLTEEGTYRQLQAEATARTFLGWDAYVDQLLAIMEGA